MINRYLLKAVNKYKSFLLRKVSLNQFAIGMRELSINLEKGIKLEVSQAMCDLHRDIVYSTPWDTGLAQANWQIEESKNPNILHKEILETKNDRHIHEMHQRMVQPAITPRAEKFSRSSSIHIFNNVDYIDDLEAGSSPQSGPGKMIADNVKKHELLLVKNLKSTGLFR